MLKERSLACGRGVGDALIEPCCHDDPTIRSIGGDGEVGVLEEVDAVENAMPVVVALLKPLLERFAILLLFRPAPESASRRRSYPTVWCHRQG